MANTYYNLSDLSIIFRVANLDLIRFSTEDVLQKNYIELLVNKGLLIIEDDIINLTTFGIKFVEHVQQLQLTE